MKEHPILFGAPMVRAHNFIDIAGQQFGKWRVLTFVGDRKWRCRCECGAEHLVGGAQLRAGKSSCCKRCAQAGAVKTHGHASEVFGFTRKYRAWVAMLGRVRDKTSPRAKWYAGVPVHPEWAESFVKFHADVPNPPSPHHTLDRIKGELGYVPGNVRWATVKEQAQNRRNNRMVTINGREQCLQAWADEIGIKESSLRYRLDHSKGVALTAPVRPMRRGSISAVSLSTHPSRIPTGKTILEHVAEQKMLPALEGPKA